MVSIEADCLNLIQQVKHVSLEPDWEIVGEVKTIISFLQEHVGWSFVWTPREANYAAHNLAQWCRSNSLTGDLCPTDCRSNVLDCDHAARRSLP